MTSTQWVEYHVETKCKTYNSLPTSDITAEAVTVDGFTLSQTDKAGVTNTNGRSYSASGMIQPRTDGRGDTTTTVTDTGGRPFTVTDAAENVTSAAYGYLVLPRFLRHRNLQDLRRWQHDASSLIPLTQLPEIACCDLVNENFFSCIVFTFHCATETKKNNNQPTRGDNKKCLNNSALNKNDLTDLSAFKKQMNHLLIF